MTEFDFEKLLAAAERRVASAEDFQSGVREIVGRAEAAKGLVKAEWTHEKGLARLDIDPRAMRLGSEELAAAITEAAQEARRKVEEETAKLGREILGEDGDAMAAGDPRALENALAEVQDALNGTLRDTTAILADLQRVFGTGR